MENLMKKRFLFISIFLCLLFVFSSCSSSVNISFSNIDNSYNNSIANYTSEVAQIDDKVYYHYRNRYGDSALYEIKSNHVAKLDEDVSLNCVYDGHFLKLNTDTNTITYLDKKSDENVVCKIPKGISPHNFLVINGDICFDTDQEIYRYNGRDFHLIVKAEKIGLKSINLYNAYIDGNTIYYLSIDEKFNKSTFIKYNCDSEELKTIVIDNGIVTRFLEHEDCVYYQADSSWCILDFANMKISDVLINGQNSYIDCLNVFGNCMCVCDGEGVYLSENRNEFIKISDDAASSIYFLDSEYIYYTTHENDLMRVTHDGTKKEKVFPISW